MNRLQSKLTELKAHIRIDGHIKIARRMTKLGQHCRDLASMLCAMINHMHQAVPQPANSLTTTGNIIPDEILHIAVLKAAKISLHLRFVFFQKSMMASSVVADSTSKS